MSLTSAPTMPLPRLESDIKPVKVVIERLPKPGNDEAFRAWSERFVAEASRAPGHEGASVFSGGGPHLILLRFASSTALEGWQRSGVFDALMRDADAVSTAGDESQIRSGLETWFTLADKPTPMKPPAKWKMAMVTWLALLPMVIALAYVFAPLQLPFLVNAAVSTAIPVVMLTWVIMPRLTRALYGWLYRA